MFSNGIDRWVKVFACHLSGQTSLERRMNLQSSMTKCTIFESCCDVSIKYKIYKTSNMISIRSHYLFRLFYVFRCQCQVNLVVFILIFVNRSCPQIAQVRLVLWIIYYCIASTAQLRVLTF